jgi:hypothetical protein
MIGVIVLSFFITGAWIKILWAIAAAVCLICLFIMVITKK